VAAGQPVLVLAKDGLREAAVDIPESSLARIRGAKATAQLYLDSALNVPATFREISGVADPVARTYQARYVLEGEATRFPLGATVTVRISTGGDEAQPTMEIPLGSLIDRGDGAAVWVIDLKTSAVAKRSVSIAKLGAETASISKGLQPGDLVVSLGAQLLNTGEVVRVAKLSAKDAR
jgi:RND family efflux transporter MFP subunit